MYQFIISSGNSCSPPESMDARLFERILRLATSHIRKDCVLHCELIADDLKNNNSSSAELKIEFQFPRLFRTERRPIIFENILWSLSYLKTHLWAPTNRQLTDEIQAPRSIISRLFSLPILNLCRRLWIFLEVCIIFFRTWRPVGKALLGRDLHRAVHSLNVTLLQSFSTKSSPYTVWKSAL